MRSLKLHQLCIKLERRKDEKDMHGAVGMTYFQTLPIIPDPFLGYLRELAHNHDSGFFCNVFLVQWKKMNSISFAMMEELSPQVRLPSVPSLNQLQEQKPQLQVLQLQDSSPLHFASAPLRHTLFWRTHLSLLPTRGHYRAHFRQEWESSHCPASSELCFLDGSPVVPSVLRDVRL